MSPELHRRVRKLFDEAMEQPPGSRLGFIETASAGDPDVMRAVVRLLEAHGDADSFLQVDTNRAQRIGRYAVTGELGRGAMGIVYGAVDPLIGRKLAIKVIHLNSQTNPGDAAFMRDRLFREARSAGMLSHPGIVTVFDVGQEGDTAFIAMERVEGLSLHQIQESGRKIERSEALEILRQTAAALDYAHRNGVVHRDIKPANIMLDNNMMVKVADFGIAKVASTQFLTQAGMVMGTPSYMSPEQLEAEPLDGRSDQFSLAVLAYELLTGTKPFHADSLATLAHMIVYSPRPSARLANPALSAAVDAVFHNGLARLPQERYPSCGKFVAALEEAWREAPEPALKVTAPVVEETPPLPPARARAAPGPGRKRASFPLRFLVAAGSAIMILAVSAALYRFFVSPSKTSASPAAVSSPVTAPAAPVVVQFTAKPQSIEAGVPAKLQWNVRGATQVVIDEGIGKVTVADTFEVMPRTPTTYVLTATGPGGMATAKVAVNVTPRKAPPDRSANGRQAYLDAVKARRAGRTTEALKLYRTAADLGEAKAMEDLGEIYTEDNEGVAKDDQEAIKWFRRAADAGNVSGMRNLGVMYYLGNGVPEDPEAAAHWYGEAANSGDADAMFNLGGMYETGSGVKKKDLKEAIELYRKATARGNAEARKALTRLRVAP